MHGLGRGESHVKEILMAGALALTLAVPQASPEQSSPQQTAPAQPQQAIPDAPRPQSAAIPSVTPGLGSSSTSSSAPAPASDPDQPPVGTTLPSSPQTAQQPVDKDPAPDLPAPGQGPTAFVLPPLTSNFVDVPFTVKDSKGALVPGITWRDVRVYENGLRQHMAVFTVDPFPLSVALVIDQSMPYDTMTRVNNALGALPASFAAADEVAVFTYNNGPRMQTEFTSGQSARLAAVVERSKSTGREPMYYNAGEALSQGININSGSMANINPLTSGGPGSPQGLTQQQVPREVHTLNDAILMAAISLSKTARDRRRIIYVISDGKEFGSVAKTKDVIHYLQENKIAVYATLVGDSSVAGFGFLERRHIPLMMRDNQLPVYTAATGGESYAEYRTRGIETSFQKIAEDVRTQYTVGYYSREPFIDGKYRKLEVRVLRPNLQVVAKDGYFPSATEVHATPPRPTTPTPQ
jgi:VWFA-related protein